MRTQGQRPLWPKTAFPACERTPLRWAPPELTAYGTALSFPREALCLHLSNGFCVLNAGVHLFLLASLLWF